MFLEEDVFFFSAMMVVWPWTNISESTFVVVGRASVVSGEETLLCRSFSTSVREAQNL